MPQQHVTAIIVNYRTPELALACLEALSSQDCPGIVLSAIVVDGHSGDHSLDLLSNAIASERFADWVTFLPLPVNGGFGWANNQAILTAIKNVRVPDSFWLINPDAVPEPGALAGLVAGMDAHPRAGAGGSQLLNEDGSVSGSAFRFPSIGRELVRGARIAALARLLGIKPMLIEAESETSAEWVTGASVMIRSEALRDSGLFDDGFFLYFEEVDLMRRMRACGWEVWHFPASLVRHIGGAATGMSASKTDLEPAPPDYWFRSRRRYFALARGRLAVLSASIAWLAGNSLWQLVAPILRRGPANIAAAERMSLLRTGLRANPSDARPAIVQWGSETGIAPAWMREG